MRVVVFGAGGGVGGWICETLADTPDVELLACVRKWASSVRLARRGLPLAQCDLEDADGVARAIAGADAVINAAMLPPPDEAGLVERLQRLCGEAGVKRLVHLSSAVVYGDRSGEVDETAPLAPNSAYARGKAETDARLLRGAETGGPQVFLFRPSIVYGPFSEPWTVRYAQRILAGRWRSLGPLGRGTCNLVHGQDVARCVVAAALAGGPDRAAAFNLNGPDTVSWNEYIERFGDALEVADRTVPSALALRASVYAGETLRGGGQWLKKNLRPLFALLTEAKGATGKMVAGAKDVGRLYPTLDECRMMQRQVHYTSPRLRQVLNVAPTTPLADGLAQSAQWCRVHGVL